MGVGAQAKSPVGDFVAMDIARREAPRLPVPEPRLPFCSDLIKTAPRRELF